MSSHTESILSAAGFASVHFPFFSLVGVVTCAAVSYMRAREVVWPYN